MSEPKKPPITKSFGYAFEGIFTCIRKERNMKIHCVMAVLVMIAGIILKLSPVEWCICLALFGLVMALELVNTAVEAVVDLVTSEYKPLPEDCQGHSCRCSSYCGNHGCNCRTYYFRTEGIGISWNYMISELYDIKAC